MSHTVQTDGGRDVTVRPVARRLPERHDGTGYGYRVDYIDGGPRLTYNADQLGADQLGRLVHELATVPAVRP